MIEKYLKDCTRREYEKRNIIFLRDVKKMGMNKEELRQKYTKLRRNIKDRKIKTNKIVSRITELNEYKDAKVVALYNSFGTEVGTTDLINHCIQKGKTVVLPRAFENDLKFYKIDSLNDKFEKSKFGVYEPIDDINRLINPNNIDLVIIPGVCFDTHKNRLGYGKGYYDRFLKETKIKNIAIGFDEQVLVNEEIPIADNDVKVDKIVTDKFLY